MNAERENAPLLSLRPLSADIEDPQLLPANVKRVLDDAGRADARPEDVLICRLVARSTDSEHGPKEAIVRGQADQRLGSLRRPSRANLAFSRRHSSVPAASFTADR